MIYLIIGHRGVGKTSWLKKLKHVLTNSRETRYKNIPIVFKNSEFIPIRFECSSRLFFSSKERETLKDATFIPDRYKSPSAKRKEPKSYGKACPRGNGDNTLRGIVLFNKRIGVKRLRHAFCHRATLGCSCVKSELAFTPYSPIENGHISFYFIDLDQEIEKQTGQKIKTLLSCKNQGKGTSNDRFRSLERNILNKLINQYKNKKDLVFIAVGAGAWHVLQQKIPSFCHIIHLARETDSQGRVFLDRPRLIPNQKPYAEYMSLYRERERFYKKIKTESFVLPERDMSFNEVEKLLFKPKGFCLANFPNVLNFHNQNKPKGFCLANFPNVLNFHNQNKAKGFCLANFPNMFNFHNNLNSIITLNKNTLPAHKKQWLHFISKRLFWGLCFFELRDDQLNPDDLRFLLKIIPKEKQLLSFRISKNSLFLKQDLSSLTWDWPLEKGPPPTVLSLPLSASLKGKRKSCQIPPPPVLSLHNRGKKESLRQVFKKITAYKASHFKLAVPIRNFKELMQGHLWFLKDPEHRSFLPISEKGEVGLWRWYRQIFGPQMKLHFIRESHGGVLDQPFLYEHLLFLNTISSRSGNRALRESLSSLGNFCSLEGKKETTEKPLSPRSLSPRKQGAGNKPDWYNTSSSLSLPFAAVLGDPVIHSASPSFHRRFFAKKRMVFTKITIDEKNFTKENLCILQKMGLVCAAVTSPLKKKAFQTCDEMDSSAKKVKSVNTLVFKNNKWFGSSTDQYGLQALLNSIKKINKTHIAVWGGGGLKKVLEKSFPKASFYSARTGQRKANTLCPSYKKNQRKKKEDTHPSIVVWAVGRNRMPTTVLPPSFWKPKWVIDLNYTENSPGKEYALLTGAKYISGITMFKHQAKKQQEIFSKYLKSKN
ncbi:MAG: hypothetical protein OXM55_02405 [Bdellovibrionales bacterium]|nr:hypothetical protein [Bdellovibrionales bacterium]